MSLADEIGKLAALRDAGDLTSEEFEAQKGVLLQGDDVKSRSVAGGNGLEWVLAFTGVAIVAGSFMPWWHAVLLVVIDRNGFQLGKDLSFSWDGVWTLAMGAVIALIGITRLTGTAFPRWISRSPVIASVIALYEALNAYTGIDGGIASQRSQYPAGSFSIGYGLWIVIVASAAALVCSVLAWWEARKLHRSEASLANNPLAMIQFDSQSVADVETVALDEGHEPSDAFTAQATTETFPAPLLADHLIDDDHNDDVDRPRGRRRRRIWRTVAVVVVAAAIAIPLALTLGNVSRPASYVAKIESIQQTAPRALAVVYEVENDGGTVGRGTCRIKMTVHSQNLTFNLGTSALIEPGFYDKYRVVAQLSSLSTSQQRELTALLNDGGSTISCH